MFKKCKSTLGGLGHENPAPFLGHGGKTTRSVGNQASVRDLFGFDPFTKKMVPILPSDTHSRPPGRQLAAQTRIGSGWQAPGNGPFTPSRGSQVCCVVLLSSVSPRLSVPDESKGKHGKLLQQICIPQQKKRALNIDNRVHARKRVSP